MPHDLIESWAGTCSPERQNAVLRAAELMQREGRLLPLRSLVSSSQEEKLVRISFQCPKHGEPSGGTKVMSIYRSKFAKVVLAIFLGVMYVC